MSTVAFGESSMSIIQVQLLYNRFKKPRKNDNDNACPVHPRTSKADENIEAVKKMILYNRRIIIRELANDVDISFDLCQAIFMIVLGMKREAAKIVPKLQNFEQ